MRRIYSQKGKPAAVSLGRGEQPPLITAEHKEPPMNIFAQIAIPLGTALAVFFAAVLAGKMRTSKMLKTLSSLMANSTNITTRIAHIRGDRLPQGETVLRGAARSPMTVDMKLAQIEQYIKRADVKMSKEEHLLLSVLMLLVSWDEEMFIVIPADGMPESLPPTRTEEEVDITEVEFARSDRPDTLLILNPRNYWLTASPNNKYEVTDRNARKEDRLVAADIPTFPDAVRIMCDHHNQRVENLRNEKARTEEAKKRLDGDLEAWTKLVVPLRRHLAEAREKGSGVPEGPR